jgi:hypothetical protein
MAISLWTREAVLGLNAPMSRIPRKLESEMTPAVKAAYLSLLDQVERLTK